MGALRLGGRREGTKLDVALTLGVRINAHESGEELGERQEGKADAASRKTRNLFIYELGRFPHFSLLVMALPRRITKVCAVLLCACRCNE